MTNQDDQRCQLEFDDLYGRIMSIAAHYGKHDAFGDGDFLIRDDNYGNWEQFVSLDNFDLLLGDFVKDLQLLLKDFPCWSIIFQLSNEFHAERLWPSEGMGLKIYQDRIVDDLQRNYLSAEYDRLKF